MEKLSKDWLTQGLIDFEYKKYVLMAYLQTVKNSFGKVELYPFLADLVFHYRNLVALKENKTLFRESFPKELSVEELKKLELRYREIIEDDAIMVELESIINFALPQIRDSLQEGSVIYEYVESQCEISPVGVTPLYAKEGYLFVTQPPEKETHIYRYQMSIFEDSQEQLRSLNTQFIDRVEKSTVNTYERLKLDLIRKFRDLPNPAAYLILARMKFPFSETLMPVAKRLFVKHISEAA
ncbi:hypothetical protein SAMN04488109_5540 [Chryseolinea serpens]|jgi:hypothetical protein|uniref:Uncharacterized protein n=1 Tax=Chryseolinea serpens TaxID=947013 RepID=A0A1M5W051_9BACT|nr:hypothetical protein [Chryseolinea serpens]SHH80594.1 hypothetical protein SAMN04488109_5540 [Chryseolinea serpens]